MKHIGIDLSFIDYHGHGEDVNASSLVIFTKDILLNFKQNQDCDFFLLCRFCDHAYIQNMFPNFKVIPIKPIISLLLYTLTSKRKLGGIFFWKNSLYRKIVKKHKLEAIWFPFVNKQNFVPSDIGCKKLLTIHDLYTWHQGIATEFFNRIFSDKDNIFTTISSYSKEDIEKEFNISNVSIIPNPVTINTSNISKIDSITDDYILDLNSYTVRKNTMTLLHAYNLIKESVSEKLVFCGGQKDESYFTELIQYTKENGLTDRVLFLYLVSEEEKNWLLANARLVVNPSLFEGFGRTPVEAAMNKVDVLSTKTTSLLEATLGLLNYYENPEDENELASRILYLLNKEKDEIKLKKIADKLTKTYAAETISNSYQELLMSL